MYQLLSRKGQAIGLGLGMLLVAIYLILIFSGLSEFNSMGEEEKMTTSIFNFGIYASIWLTIISFVVAVVAGIIHMVSDFKSSIKFLIGLVVVSVVFLIMYSISPGTPPPGMEETFIELNITETIAKMVGAGILTVILMTLLCVASIIALEVFNIFK